MASSDNPVTATGIENAKIILIRPNSSLKLNLFSGVGSGK